MTHRRRLGVVCLLVTVLLGTGVATAAWLTDGTGPSAAQATSVQSLVVTAGTPAATLYPRPAGGYGSTSIGAVHALVENPNPFPVQLTSASFGAVTATPLSGRTCAAANVRPVSPGPVALASPVTVPAGGTSPVTLPGALEMVDTAENGCQSASFTVQVTLSGASA